MTDQNADYACTHEPHGYCVNCRNPAHRYPYGWDHLGCGMNACRALHPQATCCDQHRDNTTPTCAGCSHALRLTDGIPCYACDRCERLWPASYFWVAQNDSSGAGS